MRPVIFPAEHGLYEQYLYSYPHKLAYGPLAPPRPLASLWAEEPKDALFLYVHVPYCEQRCGFCNLFTSASPTDAQHDRYLDALRRQMSRTRAALGDAATFAQYAIGGGTPTHLSARRLARLFDDLARWMAVEVAPLPGSVETSPETATEDRLRVLRERGVSRVSMGVQSFVDSELEAVARRQSARDVHAAVARVRARGFPTLNLDLMYGLPGQSAASWVASLRSALEHRPEELYLYPLYVRRLTVLGKRPRSEGSGAGDDARLALYREGRDLLLSEGYEQVSMRMFRRPSAAQPAAAYQCQRDGMVGLGPGARSYTREVHYSTPFAVSAQGVRAILEGYLGAPDAEHDLASWGYILSEEEQRRRHVILSLLGERGLDLDEYAARFGGDPRVAVPELSALEDVEAPAPLVQRRGTSLRLTAAGLERSDQVGPFLMSRAVRERTLRGDGR